MDFLFHKFSITLFSAEDTGGVLLKRVFLKISEIHRKTFVLKSLFNRISRLDRVQVFSCEFCKIFINSFFTGHLRATASGLAHLV